MIYKNIFIADDFPKGFEPSKADVPNGQRSAFEKLTSSEFACVLKCNVLFKAKVFSLIIKQYFYRNLSDIFKSLICPTRAQKAFEAGQMLTQNGFLVPPAVACGRKFLVTLEVKDSIPLCQLLDKLPPAEKQKVIEQFGQAIGKMHNKGIFHGDLRLGNILVKSAHCHFEPEGAPTRHFERSEAQSRNLFKKTDFSALPASRASVEMTGSPAFEFYFLDNERTKKYEEIPWKLRIKNIVQIYMNRGNITDDDRTLFFEAYFAQQQISIDKDKLAKKVASKTAKRLVAKDAKTA